MSQKEVEIPSKVLWGKETALALNNFPRTSLKTPRELMEAIFLIKKAAAKVHQDLGVLPTNIAEAIIGAADEALLKKLDRHFVVDAINSGAGTSLHMNVNEVLANRATVLLRRKLKKNAPVVDPHTHVNCGQSTNDVIPAAIRMALVKISSELIFELTSLREVFKNKAGELWEIKTAGRTHMRDALPISMGQRFLAYADRIDEVTHALARSRFSMRKLGIGGTAVGSGANTVPDYRRRIIFVLRELTGINFEEHYNLFAAMSGMGEYAIMAGALDAAAIELSNIAHDLSLSSSGPRCGLGELILPAVQPGSSIMPGKVNPTICENLIMTCRVISGNTATVRLACLDVRWELNPSILIIGLKLLESVALLKNAAEIFRGRCIKGIKADEKRCSNYYENSTAWPTLLNDTIGYAKARELVCDIDKEISNTGETVLDAIIRLTEVRGIRTKSGEPITKSALERLAFPKY